jgi:hypothetical protein
MTIPHRDQVPSAVSGRPDHHNQAVGQISSRNEPVFAVVPSDILIGCYLAHEHRLSVGKVQAPFHQDDRSFGRVEADVHRIDVSR